MDRFLKPLADVAISHRPFEAGFSGMGIFESHRESVLWVGVHPGAHELTALASSVRKALLSLTHEPEERPFVPHLTVARLKNPPIPLSTEWTCPPDAVFMMDRISLIQSVLAPHGAEHRPLLTFPLGGSHG